MIGRHYFYRILPSKFKVRPGCDPLEYIIMKVFSKSYTLDYKLLNSAVYVMHEDEHVS